MSFKRRDTSRRLITSKDTALSTMRLQPGSFQRQGSYSSPRSNVRERRTIVSFESANAPKVIYHGLGFAPSGFTVLGQNAAGHVYNDFPIPSTSRVIVLKCDTANVVADILVR